MDTEADERRFAAFVQSTTPDDRDYLAFYEFTYAVHSAVRCAGLVTPCDDRAEGAREREMLHIAIGEMLFSVLPRVELAAVTLNAEGIGFAVRYGLLDAHPRALDRVPDTEAFERLAQAGFAADAAHCCREQNRGEAICDPCRLFDRHRVPS